DGAPRVRPATLLTSALHGCPMAAVCRWGAHAGAFHLPRSPDKDPDRGGDGADDTAEDVAEADDDPEFPFGDLPDQLLDLFHGELEDLLLDLSADVDPPGDVGRFFLEPAPERFGEGGLEAGRGVGG